ncbi:sensor domain-containing diguanylate cyclase [Neobacillus sp. D3-1R]|uniref:sensor domain-containing diguanylate cyclase n=1 Tax=Neobacillus sp. D3-1R TaxID=3445778 RepID=UPI003FA005B0
MLIQYIPFFFYTLVIAIIANYFRFKVGDTLNKWILMTSSLVIVEVHGFLFESIHTSWLNLLFIGVSVLCFNILGGLISIPLAWIFLLNGNESDFIILISYFLFAIGLYFIMEYIREIKNESEYRLTKLLENSKQLNVFKEVSINMQETLQLEKLLKTILTSVTAGHGLGFNRAMILLINEDGTKLNGIMGTGPMTAEEGYATWERITKKKYKLKDLIEIKETEKSTDLLLNERVKKLEILLNENHFLFKALESGTPYHIKNIDHHDETLMLFVREFNMDELAIFPLMNQGIKVGVLIIDNPVNKKPITADGMESVIPLANQAAIAIHHASLYSKIEEMALKDGLTGLYNQRAFQNSFEKYFLKESHAQLSLILIDIDSFKHFNDTNGHLLGNQVLIQLADVIKHSLYQKEIAYRFGGEEFVIVLPNANLEDASILAEQIRQNVESTSFPCGEKQPTGRLTISLGVASTRELESLTADHLFEAADRALYKAKETGKNKVVTYEGVWNL